MTLEMLTAFFGWMTLINLGFFLVTVISMFVFKNLGTRLHAAMFGLPQEGLTLVWYKFLGHYKLAFIMLNLVPYLALRAMM